jgi:predicted MFS family arabinose efflux permease
MAGQAQSLHRRQKKQSNQPCYEAAACRGFFSPCASLATLSSRALVPKSGTRASRAAFERTFLRHPQSAAPAAPAREIRFAALHHPAFRVYFLTTALAMMGDNIEHIISYWVLFEVFHSPALGGFAILSHWLPFLFFSVYFGALADRYDCRRVIQVAMLLFMGVSLAWGLLFLTGTMQLWHAAVLLMIHGMAGVLWGPGSQLLIHQIVGTQHLQSAVRLNSTSRMLGVLLGPAVGGGLMLAFGPPAGLIINALLYLPLLIWLWKAPVQRPEPTTVAEPAAAPSAATRGAGRGGLGETFSLLKSVSSNHILFSMIALAGVSSFFIGSGMQPQMPEFAHDLGTDEAGLRYSVLLGANAAGAVAGGLILESRGLLPASPRSAIILCALWCLSMVGFAATSSYSMALALMIVAGFLNLTFSAMTQTLVQVHSPAPLRGRLIGLYNTANNGLRAFSGVTIGIVGSLIGIHWSLALSAMALMAGCFVLLAFAMRPR